ncbi:MAG TPA: ATP-dependent Clp protease ATP-binding subunit ClpX [Candidatus Paceibacterota bacterium]|nr:ATP-dependent Clp protease ATP-binding subunit ClpX [Candidatus Paceibacterota bacterium]
MHDGLPEIEPVDMVPPQFGRCYFCGSDSEAMMRGPCIAENFQGEAKQYILDALTLVGLYDPEKKVAQSTGFALICADCVYGLAEWFDDEAVQEDANQIRAKSVKMTPGRIQAMLDKIVIGQERAKRALSIAVWQHYMRIRAKSEDLKHPKAQGAEVNIEKSNVLLIGPTGCGKTLLVQAIARYLEVPFATIDASMVTASGYVGANSNDALRQLFYQAEGDLALAGRGIICVDEIDKIVAKETTSGADVGGIGAQQTFLKIIEGADVPFEVPLPSGAKLERVMDTRNILFIGSGAFPGLNKIKRAPKSSKEIGFMSSSVKKTEEQESCKKVLPEDLVKYGFIEEFCGRFPVIETLDALSRQDLERVLIEPQSSLVKQYKKLFRIAGVELEITEEVLASVVEEAVSKKMGARGLRGALEARLQSVLFTVPDLKLQNSRLKKVIVDKECAGGGSPKCEFRPIKVKIPPIVEIEG